jgi:membrane-associated phospholipid phosphatase
MLARREKTLCLIAAFALVVVGACYIAVRLLGPLPGELRFEAWRVAGGYPSAWDRPLTFVTHLGDSWVAAGSVLLLALVAAEEAGSRAAVTIVAAAGSAIGAEVLSAVLGPTSQEYDGAAGTSLGPGDNFPSGHAAYAVSVFGVASWLAFERGHRALSGALGMPVVLMGPALALLGNHYPADILAGYAFGLAWGIGALLAVAVLSGDRRAPDSAGADG